MLESFIRFGVQRYPARGTALVPQASAMWPLPVALAAGGMPARHTGPAAPRLAQNGVLLASSTRSIRSCIKV